MKETSNYKLKKPGYSDVADIEVINENMDKIDTTLKNKSDSTHNHNSSYEPRFSKRTGFNLNKSSEINRNSESEVATAKAVKLVNDKVESNKSDISSLKNTQSSLVGEIQSARKGESNLRNKVDSIDATIGSIQSEVKNARKGKGNLVSKINEMDSKISDLTNNVNDSEMREVIIKESVIDLEECKNGSIKLERITGKTLVNLLNERGSFKKDSDNNGLPDGVRRSGIDTTYSLSTDCIVGTKSVKVDSSNFGRFYFDETNTVAGHKYYARCYAKKNSDGTSDRVLSMQLASDQYLDQNIGYIAHQANFAKNASSWHLVSGITTAVINNANFGIRGITGEWLFSGFTLIDLTEHFGAGKEPSKEWCDQYIEYFEGIRGGIIGSVRSVGRNLFNINKLWKHYGKNLFSIVGKKIIFHDTTEQVTLATTIKVKKNTNYYLNYNSSGNGAAVHIYKGKYCDFSNGVGSGKMTFNSGDFEDITLYPLIVTGSGELDEISLVESNSEPDRFTPYEKNEQFVSKNGESYEFIVQNNSKGDFSEFNLLNLNSIESGGLSESDNGGETVNDTRVRTEFLSVRASREYSLSINRVGNYIFRGVFEYDENKDLVIFKNLSSDSIRFTTESNTRFIRVLFYETSDNQITPNDIEIRKPSMYEGDRYYSNRLYQEVIPIPIELHNINGINDEIINNTLIKRNNKRILDGSEEWSEWIESDNVYGCVAEVLDDTFINARLLSDSLKSYLANELYPHDIEGITLSSFTAGKIALKISKSKLESNDVNGVKKYLQENNISLIYNLKEEFYETEVIEGFNNNITCFDGGHIEFDFEGAMPEVELSYPVNTGAQIDSISIQAGKNAEQINNSNIEINEAKSRINRLGSMVEVLKINLEEGKQAVVDAINNKGGSATIEDSFDQLAEKISNIRTDTGDEFGLDENGLPRG